MGGAPVLDGGEVSFASRDTDEVEDVAVMVRRARAQLHDWANKPPARMGSGLRNRYSQLSYLHNMPPGGGALGGIEGIAPLMVLAQLGDKDGIIGPDKIKEYEAACEKLVEATLNFNLNIGVVAALILSIFYPLASTLVSDEDNQDNFSGNLIYILQVAGYICCQIVVTSAISQLFICGRMYTHIAFWMPNLRSKVWYISTRGQGITLALAIINQISLCAVGLTLLFGSLVSIGWLGFVSVLPASVSVIAWLVWDNMNTAAAYGYLHKQAKALFTGTRTIN